MTCPCAKLQATQQELESTRSELRDTQAQLADLQAALCGLHPELLVCQPAKAKEDNKAHLAGGKGKGKKTGWGLL